MNMNQVRLDDKLNATALAVIVAIALSIGSAFVSIDADTSAAETAQAVPAQTAAPTQVVASVTAVAAQ